MAGRLNAGNGDQREAGSVGTCDTRGYREKEEPSREINAAGRGESRAEGDIVELGEGRGGEEEVEEGKKKGERQEQVE